jgi:hypothetical protein
MTIYRKAIKKKKTQKTNKKKTTLNSNTAMPFGNGPKTYMYFNNTKKSTANLNILESHDKEIEILQW